jgi:hypothetical protein
VRPVAPQSGTTGIVDPVSDRPATFQRANWEGGGCPGAGYDELAFRDAGRVFLARISVVVTPDGDVAALQRVGLQVLDTLHVDPLDGVTTTTTPSTTPPTAPATTDPTLVTLPSPTTPTAAPPFVPTTDDENAIVDLFVAWLRDHPDDETRLIVEDADALLPAIHQGLAQHSADDLAKYSGTVSDIRMLDADHAEVQYTLLHDGQPQFGLRTGTAVRIDGTWMVSRATECALLSLGGIVCPPAS